MKKIRIEVEVPNDDCVFCDFFNVRNFECSLFKERVKRLNSENIFLLERCSKCISSEVNQ